jgi:hypothetical protein
MLKPIVLECGHSYCDSCAKRVADGPLPGRKCPSCRRVIHTSSKDLPTNISLKILLCSLPAKCKNEGCSWLGKAGYYDTHSHGCEFKAIACDFQEHGCSFMCTRGELQEHKSMCNFVLKECVKCMKYVPRNRIEEHQKKECSKRSVFCPYYKGAEDRHSIRK